MPKFVFAYHGGTAPLTPEEGKKAMAQWTAWYEKMGSAIVDGGAPVGPSKTVTPKGVQDNGGANPISGYTVIEAIDITAALAMARDCPLVVDGSGSVEVAEAVRM